MESKKRFQIALQELVLDAKCQALNRLYSRGTMWIYLKRHFGSSEAVLERARAILRSDGTVVWPVDLKEQRRFVLRYHAWAVEEMCQAVKTDQATAMFGSRKRMLRYLRHVYRNSSSLSQSIQDAACRGRRKTYDTGKSESIDC